MFHFSNFGPLFANYHFSIVSSKIFEEEDKIILFICILRILMKEKNYWK